MVIGRDLLSRPEGDHGGLVAGLGLVSLGLLRDRQKHVLEG